MRYTVLIFPVILPVLFWACYHYYKDRHLPEPVSHLLLAFTLGVGSFYLGLLMYRALDLVNLRYDAYLLAETNLPGFFAYAVLVIGVIEELAKMIPFLLFVIHFKEYKVLPISNLPEHRADTSDAESVSTRRRSDRIASFRASRLGSALDANAEKTGSCWLFSRRQFLQR